MFVTGYLRKIHGEWNPSEGLLANPRKLTLDPYARALEGAPVLGPEIFVHEVDADYNPLYVPFTPSALDSAGHVAVGVVTDPSFPVVPGPKVPQERTVIYETHVKGLTLNMFMLFNLQGFPEYHHRRIKKINEEIIFKRNTPEDST